MSIATEITSGFVVNDRYEIGRELGSGGFAMVFEARDLQIDRPVAIKLMRVLEFAESSDVQKQLLERFAREAQLAAKIEHPNVAQVFDFGVVKSYGEPFIVMELMRGRDLAKHLRESGPLHPERALPLFVDALYALGLAHEQGIVHKDLKPANLFLKNPGTRFERLCIFDFGIAHIEHDAQRRLTRDGQITGTAAYLPPEYATDQIVTPALDIYQMGLILVEALTGEAVVQDKEGVIALFKHVRGDLNLPEPLMESPLGDVLRTSMSLMYADRYQQGTAFADALAKIDATTVPANLGTPREETSPSNESGDFVPGDTGRQEIDSGRDLDTEGEAEPAEDEDTRVMEGAPAGAKSASNHEPTRPAGPAPANLRAPSSGKRVSPNEGRTVVSSPSASNAEPEKSHLPLILVAALMVAGTVGAALVLVGSLNSQQEPTTSVTQQTGKTNAAGAARPATNTSTTGRRTGPQFMILDTRPTHATVYERGEVLGKTPLDLEFESAQAEPREVRLELEGHEPIRTLIRPSDQPRRTIDLEAEPQEPTPEPEPEPEPKPRPKPDPNQILLPD